MGSNDDKNKWFLFGGLALVIAALFLGSKLIGLQFAKLETPAVIDANAAMLSKQADLLSKLTDFAGVGGPFLLSIGTSGLMLAGAVVVLALGLALAINFVIWVGKRSVIDFAQNGVAYQRKRKDGRESSILLATPAILAPQGKALPKGPTLVSRNMADSPPAWERPVPRISALSEDGSDHFDFTKPASTSKPGNVLHVPAPRFDDIFKDRS